MFNVGDYVVSSRYFLAVVKDIIKNKYEISYIDDNYTVVTSDLEKATESNFTNQIKLLDDCLYKSRGDLERYLVDGNTALVDATRTGIERLVRFRYNTTLAYENFLNKLNG